MSNPFQSKPLTEGQIKWAIQQTKSMTQASKVLNVSSDELSFGPSTSINTYVIANAIRSKLRQGDEIIGAENSFIGFRDVTSRYLFSCSTIFNIVYNRSSEIFSFKSSIIRASLFLKSCTISSVIFLEGVFIQLVFFLKIDDRCDLPENFSP